MNGGAASGYAEVRIMNVLVRLPIPRIPVGYEFWKFGTPKPGQLYIPHNDPERKVPAFEVKKCEKNFIKASVETTRAIVRKAKNWAVPTGLAKGRWVYTNSSCGGKTLTKVDANGRSQAVLGESVFKALYGENAQFPPQVGTWEVTEAQGVRVA
jgi:hypothetical protein